MVSTFNPFEKYARQIWIIFPKIGVKINIWNHYQANDGLTLKGILQVGIHLGVGPPPSNTGKRAWKSMNCLLGVWALMRNRSAHHPKSASRGRDLLHPWRLVAGALRITQFEKDTPKDLPINALDFSSSSFLCFTLTTFIQVIIYIP